MLNNIIDIYNKTKFAIVEKFSGYECGIYDEISWIDNGYIISKIEKLKKEEVDISKEIELTIDYDKKDEYSINKINSLINRQQEIKIEITFLASNSFSNIDSCLQLLSNIDIEFKKCLYALKFFNEDKKEEAFSTFYEYFNNKDFLLEHYLINKTFGILLSEIKEYELSTKFLRKASEKRPEDKELHSRLKRIYELQGKSVETNIERDIIELLEGNL